MCKESRAEYNPVNKMRYQGNIKGAASTPTTTEIGHFLDRQEEEQISLEDQLVFVIVFNM